MQLVLVGFLVICLINFITEAFFFSKPTSCRYDNRRISITSARRIDHHKVTYSKLYLNPDELSEEELQSIYDLALGEEHHAELSKKVEESMLEDWDMRDGVIGFRRKPLPLKANIDLWSYYAKQAFLQGNYTLAEEWYQKCIDYNPVDGRAWLGMSRIHMKKGNIGETEKAYRDGLYYNPKNPYLMQAYAAFMDKQGRYQPAIKLLTSSVKMNPTHAASWVELGRINQKQGRIDEARFCYQSAVEGDPRSYYAYQIWGVMESELNNVDEARRLFSKSSEVNRRSAHALQAWASLEKRLGNYENAEDILMRAIDAWPDSTLSAAALADIYELTGRVNEAREVFANTEKKAEAVGDAGLFQAWAMFELRQDKSSYSNYRSSYEGTVLARPENDAHRLTRSLFKKAVLVNKKHSASWVAWAKFEQRLGNKESARRLLVAGISNFPTSRNIGWFHCALGNLAKHDGDINTARACYDRALDATPPQKSLPVILEYAKMEAVSGGIQEARRLYELALVRFSSDDRVWEQYVEFEKRRTGGDRMQELANRRSQLEVKKNLGKEIPPHTPRIDDVFAY